MPLAYASAGIRNRTGLYIPQGRPQDADLVVTVYSDLRKDFR